MSERQYFSLRYTIPGFTFILVVAAINYPLLLATLETDFQSAFALIFSLLSGPATGFLISQFWWWRFQKNCGLLGVPGYETAFRAFVDKYRPKKTRLDEYEKDERRQLIVALDYVSHMEIKKNLLILAERKWDMYHILSSTYHTLRIAAVAGLLCRLCYELSLLNLTYGISWQSLTTALSKNLGSAVILVVIVAVLTVWICLFQQTRGWMLTQIIALSEARIRSSKVRRHELVNAFPHLF